MAVSYENLPGAGSAPRGADHSGFLDLHVAGPLDATLPPTPIRELLAASGATVFVLATDANFIATIRRAAEQHPLYVVESWPELVEAVEAGRCGIALLDATLLGARVSQCVARLAVYNERLVTLVAADRTSAQEYVGLLAAGRIHRLLIKPVAIGAARLLIESATARRLQLRDEAAKPSAPEVVAVSSRVPTWVWGTAAGVGAVVLLGLALAGAGLDWWNRSAVVETAAPADGSEVTSETLPGPVDPLADLRAKASLALQEGRLAEPAGDNAVEHYLAVLALAPGDQAARDGLSSARDGLFKRAEVALLADDLETAAAALDQVRRVDPASSRLAFLDAQLARGLAVLAAPPPAPAASPPVTAASPTELDSVLSLARARLGRGQILAPAGDSSVAYLERATQISRDDPRVGVLRAEVSAALIAAARLVFDADVASAANLAGEARRLGFESASLVALEADVGAALAREQQQQLSERLDTARLRVRSGALFVPASDSALDHLTALQAEAPLLGGLAEEWEAFRQAAVLAIESSIERGDWGSADDQLAGLAQAPAGAIAAQPLAAELGARRQQEAYLATAAPASVMRMQSSTPAVYPADLLQRGVEGWVELEFVVDRSGSPRDLVVKQAAPAGRFDDAALEAVRQYRYVPFEQDGRVYERRVKLRVRFEVQ
ncbi:MAG TPA: energy transducer TonB [Gammaproteobacteria bacterium]